MCGFAGIWSAADQASVDVGEVALRMSSLLSHRGPDDRGVWRDQSAGIGFGFRRLAIVDVSEQGHQPMESSSGRYLIMFNGEIYNFRVLRRELEQRGCTFHGHSDTEVLLAAIEEWGLGAAVQRLAGMFAIALWDGQKRRLHLIRDRLGIKPLYYSITSRGCTFGSELKALTVAPGFDDTIDKRALVSYFRYHYIPEPSTIYRSVYKLLPGTMLTLESPVGRPILPVPYWSLGDVAQMGRSRLLNGPDHTIVEAAHELLRDVVADHLYADVRVGAFLSGGIDSSLVVALMKAVAGDRVDTFAISFEESDYDEAAYAARVAKHLGTNHSEMRLGATDALGVIPRLPSLFDEPFGNSSAIASLLVCEFARTKVSVALSGTGGDEMFGGYSRYVHGERIVQTLSRVPAVPRRFASALLKNIPSVYWDYMFRLWRPAFSADVRLRMPTVRGAKIARFGEMLGQPSQSEMYRSMMTAWENPERLVIDGQEEPAPFEEAFALLSDASLLDRFMLTDQCGYLVGDQMTIADRASMAVSLEVRVPLLDHRVAEFAWRLPTRFKKRNGTGKWLLRQVLDSYVPRTLVERPKMGLSLPIGRWLAGPLRPWAEELLDPKRIDRDGLLRSPPIAAAWKELLAGGEQRAEGIWNVLMFQAWLEQCRTLQGATGLQMSEPAGIYGLPGGCDDR
jgi:asparagine synthase (glutamine-hydrolysing)